MSWFRFLSNKAEVADKLEDFLEFVLRALRDQNEQEDYSSNFSLQLAKKLIRFHHPEMPPEERKALVGLMNKILGPYWSTLRIRQCSESLSKLYEPAEPGCKFELNIASLHRWQIQNQGEWTGELRSRADFVGREICRRCWSTSNPDPVSWQVVAKPGINSAWLEVWPNKGNQYPLGREHDHNWYVEVEEILFEYPELGLRVARFQDSATSCRRVLFDLIVETEKGERADGVYEPSSLEWRRRWRQHG